MRRGKFQQAKFGPDSVKSLSILPIISKPTLAMCINLLIVARGSAGAM
jgi:hypothetical protein